MLNYEHPGDKEEEFGEYLDSEKINVGDEPDMNGPEWGSETSDFGFAYKRNEMADFANGIIQMWAELRTKNGKPQPVGDYAELAALLSGIRPGYTKNEDRFNVYSRALQLAKRIAQDSGIHQQYLSQDTFGAVGRIILEGSSSAVMSDTKRLRQLMELADEVKIYPTASGRARISLGFFELYDISPEATMIPMAVAAFKNDRHTPTSIRMSRAKSLIKRGKRDERLAIMCDKENKVAIESNRIDIDDTWSFAIAVNSADGARIEPSDDGKARLTLEFEKKKG